MKDKVFIVEDDELIVKLLRDKLQEEFRVMATNNFRDVTTEIQTYQPNLILMDITLPYFNGFYWTTEIRKTSDVPIIFISSATDEMNAVMAMNMGADDFISKPFSIDILIAKMNALLRRTKLQVKHLNFDNYTLDLEGRFSDGEEAMVALTKTETIILKILLEQAGTIVAKQDILKKLWESDDFIDDNTLNVNMSRLRKKLLQVGFEAIHTVRGVGYVVK